MSDENVANRLKRFIEAKGLSYSQFADSCGIPRPSLSQLLTGRNKKINDIMVGQIHSEFPELSIVWLLFGEGNMFNAPARSTEDDDSYIENMDLVGSGYQEGSGESEKNTLKNLNNLTGDKGSDKFLKENGLKNGNIGGYSADNKVEMLNLRIKELTSQIDKMRKNPRKVSSITVYYDDSTFETFIPASRVP